MKKTLFALVLFADFAFCVGLSVYSNGNERIPLTSKAWAVGNAMTANPEYALGWYNPARLAFSSGLQFSVGDAIRKLDRNESFFAGEYKIPQKRVGVSGIFSYKGIANLDSLRKDGVIYNSTSYISTTTKIGAGIAITGMWGVGVSGTWYYTKIPVRFNEDAKSIETSSSGTIGGLSFMGTYVNPNGFSLGFGVRDIFSYNDWSYNETPNSSMIMTIIDTLPAVLVAGANYVFKYKNEKEIRFSGDFNGYLINSFFRKYENVAVSINGGFEWRMNKIIVFRTGIRDILCNRNYFKDRPQWRLENNPRLGFGIGLNLESVVNWKIIKKFGVNYAVSNSGAEVGLEHVVDLIWKF
ncbi:MAG: hypothetical protein LBH98_08740 [Chitinispirillales bacterium]|jgi:hypothetical protein|nr:hypothetical protein [Chitinispirillales bacterium]